VAEVIADFRTELEPLVGAVIGSQRNLVVVVVGNSETTRIAAAVLVVVPLKAAVEVQALAAVVAEVRVNVVGVFTVVRRQRLSAKATGTRQAERGIGPAHLGVHDLVDVLVPVVLNAQLSDRRVEV